MVNTILIVIIPLSWSTSWSLTNSKSKSKEISFSYFLMFFNQSSYYLSLLFTIITSVLLLSPTVSQNNFNLAPACGKKDEFLTEYANIWSHIIFRHSWRQSCAFLWMMSVFHWCCCSNALSEASAHRSFTEVVQKSFLTSG